MVPVANCFLEEVGMGMGLPHRQAAATGLKRRNNPSGNSSGNILYFFSRECHWRSTSLAASEAARFFACSSVMLAPGLSTIATVPMTRFLKFLNSLDIRGYSSAYLPL